MAGDDAITKVTLDKPAPGETAQISIEPGHVYVLGFYLDITTFTDDGRDIRILFDDGSHMVLRDFFSAAKTGDFYLELPDGAMLLGKDIADAMSYKLEDFQPSGGFFLPGEAYAGVFLSDREQEDGPVSGLQGLNSCEPSVCREAQDLFSATDTLAPIVPLTPQAGHSPGNSGFRSFAEELDSPVDTLLASSRPLSSTHGGSLFLHLDDLLDTTATQAPFSAELEGLLAARPSAESGPVPGTVNENTTVPPGADDPTALQPAEFSGGETEQCLLTYLLLTSL